MPRPRPPHLHQQVTRHGKIVWYVRHGKGPRVRIKAVYGTDEFEEAYQAALQGKQPQGGAAKAKRGTLEWLFQLYRQSTAWTDLAQSTRYKREKIMMRVLETAGHQPVSAINEASVIKGRERRAATPASAQAFIDTLHGLFKWAVKSKLAASDPTLNVKVETKPKRKGGYPPWTDEDMAKFEARWPRGTRERVLFDILCYTGLRIGDVAVLGRQHVRNGVIRIDSEKTGMRVEIPDAGPAQGYHRGRTNRRPCLHHHPAWHTLEQERVGCGVCRCGPNGWRQRQISPWLAQGSRNPCSRKWCNRARIRGHLRLVRG
jgi:integrase